MGVVQEVFSPLLIIFGHTTQLERIRRALFTLRQQVFQQHSTVRPAPLGGLQARVCAGPLARKGPELEKTRDVKVVIWLGFVNAGHVHRLQLANLALQTKLAT